MSVDPDGAADVPISPTKPFYKVVLTGGPCAGKTSSLAFIADHFRNLGWHVYTCPEATTLLVSGGVSWAALNPQQWFNFQMNVINTMKRLEGTYEEVATLRDDDKPVLILCDRGIMDPAAYVDKPVFAKLLTAANCGSVFEVKQRYDLVVHLVSAARGAEDYYSLENNQARTESAEEAREVDSRLLKAWAGHPNIVCINNRTLFKQKMIRALQEICKRVGAPPVGNSTVKRKFLVSALYEDKMTDLHIENALCTYIYLQDGSDTQQRLKKRKTEGSCAYTHVIRALGRSGSYERYTETSRNISKREYQVLTTMKLADHVKVQIQKRSFVFDSQYFSLAIFESIHPGLMLLELYEEPDVEIELPVEFMKISKEVTSDLSYSMFNLSHEDSLTTPIA